jgi:hypothetical protein
MSWCHLVLQFQLDCLVATPFLTISSPHGTFFFVLSLIQYAHCIAKDITQHPANGVSFTKTNLQVHLKKKRWYKIHGMDNENEAISGRC